MAFQQNFDSPAMNFGSQGNGLLKQKLNSVSASATATASENVNGCFDCNICLDSSNEPVVTLCGHLYRWPCIYKWLQVQNTSPDSDGQPKCPVCKSYISTSSMVPLYGRGGEVYRSANAMFGRFPRVTHFTAGLGHTPATTSNWDECPACHCNISDFGSKSAKPSEPISATEPNISSTSIFYPTVW